MTVISTVVAQHSVVHATDSLITIISKGGGNVPITWRGKKLLRVPQWNVILSFWGLAEIDRYRWLTINWIENKVHNSWRFATPELFALDIAAELNKAFICMGVNNLPGAGLGIHLTAYEKVNNNFIPELFLISNWADTLYTSLKSTGFEVTRETSATALNIRENIGSRNDRLRLQFHNWLQGGRYLVFNNGDPMLYNTAANAVTGMVYTLSSRNVVKYANRLETFVKIARLPVDTVTHVQKQLCKKGRQVVGGRTRDIAVTNSGIYSSTSGD